MIRGFQITENLTLRCYVLIGLLFVFEIVYGQKIEFKKFNTSNGLPSVEVYDMYQDENGLIWFATDRGIASFDGNNFRKYSLNDGITCTTVFRFFPQPNGQVWCTTMNGKTFYFNPDDYKMHAYEYNDIIDSKYPWSLPNDLYLDQKNTLHIGFVNYYGITEISDKGAIIKESNPWSEADSMFISIKVKDEDYYLSYVDLTKDNSDLFSVKTNIQGTFRKSFHDDDIDILVDDHSVYVSVNGGDKVIIERPNRPLNAGRFDSNHIWVSYLNGGVVTYDLSGKRHDTFLQNESITDVLFDHDNGVWFSSLSSGVFYGLKSSVYSVPLEDNSNISSLSKEGKCLFINSEKGELFKFQNGILTSILKSVRFGLTTTTTYSSKYGCTVVLHEGDLKHLPEEGGFILKGHFSGVSDDENQWPIPYIRNTFFLRQRSGEWKQYIVLGAIHDVSYGEDGVYLGKEDGLYYFDTLNESVHRLYQDQISSRVTDIDHFDNDLFFVGTMGQGVFILNKDEIIQVGVKQGLANLFVNQVFVENEKVVWIGTNLGLYRLQWNGSKFDVDRIGLDEGLINEDVTDIEIIDDQLWVSTRGGLNMFDMKSLKDREVLPSYFLTITNMSINNVSRIDLGSLSYDQNNLKFDFRAVSFRQLNALKFRYKLLGHDKEWNYTMDRSVSYGNIQPGMYEFILEVGDGSNWSERQTIPVSIFPPFYETKWFKIGVVLFSAFIVYLFFKYRILSYNRDIIREILRQMLKRIKGDDKYFTIRVDGKDLKVLTTEVLYVKSADNYIQIVTSSDSYLTRERISNFINLVPDPLEYLRVHRSYVIRIDKVKAKSSSVVQINDIEIKVGTTYRESLSKIHVE